jgi:hypothetical protein
MSSWLTGPRSVPVLLWWMPGEPPHQTTGGPARHPVPEQSRWAVEQRKRQVQPIILVGICRAPGDPSTWHDLSLDALLDFWTKIWGMRGRNSHLRAFVEGYIADCPKVSPWEYQFLLTMEMLTTIRNLSFLREQ